MNANPEMFAGMSEKDQQAMGISPAELDTAKTAKQAVIETAATEQPLVSGEVPPAVGTSAEQTGTPPANIFEQKKWAKPNNVEQAREWLAYRTSGQTNLPSPAGYTDALQSYIDHPDSFGDNLHENPALRLASDVPLDSPVRPEIPPEPDNHLDASRSEPMVDSEPVPVPKGNLDALVADVDPSVFVETPSSPPDNGLTPEQVVRLNQLDAIPVGKMTAEEWSEWKELVGPAQPQAGSEIPLAQMDLSAGRLSGETAAQSVSETEQLYGPEFARALKKVVQERHSQSNAYTPEEIRVGEEREAAQQKERNHETESIPANEIRMIQHPNGDVEYRYTMPSDPAQFAAFLQRVDRLKATLGGQVEVPPPTFVAPAPRPRVERPEVSTVEAEIPLPPPEVLTNYPPLPMYPKTEQVRKERGNKISRMIGGLIDKVKNWFARGGGNKEEADQTVLGWLGHEKALQTQEQQFRAEFQRVRNERIEGLKRVAEDVYQSAVVALGERPRLAKLNQAIETLKQYGADPNIVAVARGRLDKNLQAIQRLGGDYARGTDFYHGIMQDVQNLLAGVVHGDLVENSPELKQRIDAVRGLFAKPAEKPLVAQAPTTEAVTESTVDTSAATGPPPAQVIPITTQITPQPTSQPTEAIGQAA